ncbi:MAG TPA: hypothetical protein VGQ46_12865 [Thermoanaerobaculia bacterium]|jgi:hypothetical protein|nr:hypothetical protein [Thermoanaerobaculia bacterium]
MQHLTQHLTEDELISHYYHDGDAPFAAGHLAACDECRAQFDTLCGVLTLVDQLPTPERGDAYGDEVWTRLRWKLGSNRRRSVYGWMSIAAALVVAFIGGILWHSRTQQAVTRQTIVARKTPAPAAQPAAIASASKDRLLLVVVSDHLDSSERMLLEISNADAKHPLDVASESKRAGELVASNRIYRQTATRRGETRIASLLSDLEPVLVELSHAGSTLSPDEIAALQKRIDSKGLLFKVRVVSAQVGGHEAPAIPQKGIDSL